MELAPCQVSSIVCFLGITLCKVGAIYFAMQAVCFVGFIDGAGILRA
jgi:hypothetical protein